MDSGIKLIVFIVLGIAPFFIGCYINYILLLTYLFAATILFGVRLQVVLKNILAYIIIIIIPYIFGLLIAVIFSKITGTELTALYGSLEEVAFRLFQLFILWYAGIIYLNSTKIESLMGVFDKLLSPLQRFGVPVTDFLKVIMCVIHELKELAPEAKKSFSESFSSIFGKRNGLSKSKMEGIGNILVSFFVKSFERMGKVEDFVKIVENKDLFYYKFSISMTDVIIIVSMITLILSMIIISNTVCIFP